jgi:uncharacterized protein with HEPN domain
MTRGPLEWLADARAFAQHAMQDAGGLSAEVLAGASQPQHAALYDLIVIGEALNNVPEDLQSLASEIPWAAIVALRNRIAHAYWQTDLEIVANIIENRLEPLMQEIDRLVELIKRTEA